MDKDYNEENTKLLFGDCLERMKEIEDNSVDLICTDLPYGVTKNKIDVALDLKKLWVEYDRISKPTTPILLFGQGLFYVDLVNSNRYNFRYDIVWDKKITSGFLNAKRMPLRCHEQIAVFYKKLGCYNPQFTEGIPLHSKGSSYLNKEHKNQNYGLFQMTDDNRKGSTQKYPKSIMSFQKPHPSNAIHPTQKSLELLETLIKQYSNENDLVLDSTMGSNTTGLACKKLNRIYVGIEKDETIFELAVKRITDFKQQ